MSKQHQHMPGDFCFVRSDELREALGSAYSTTQKFNLWWVFQRDGSALFVSRLIPTDLISDLFREIAFQYMTRIAKSGWDAFVEYYEAEMRKPRQPCLLDQLGAGAGANKHLHDE